MNYMNIAITGGTVLIGLALTKRLLEQGHHIFILTRHPKANDAHVTYIKWMTEDAKPEQHLEGVDAFIHLAGASINDGRWTDERKRVILDSRAGTTKELVRIVEALDPKPNVVLSASAFGIYGQDRHQTFSEDQSLPPTADFLSHVCVAWEDLARPIADAGNRLVHPRIGVVLTKAGGAYPLMCLPYVLSGGGTMGDGKRWVSWVHYDDLVDLFLFALVRRIYLHRRTTTDRVYTGWGSCCWLFPGIYHHSDLRLLANWLCTNGSHCDFDTCCHFDRFNPACK
jgi:uncharacterized protein (TIGR01777 family)